MKVGDIVELSCGSRLMVVEYVQERGPSTDKHWEADCVWHSVDGYVQRASFRIDCLRDGTDGKVIIKPAPKPPVPRT